MIDSLRTANLYADAGDIGVAIYTTLRGPIASANRDEAEQLRDWLNAFLLERDKAAVLAKYPKAVVCNDGDDDHYYIWNGVKFKHGEELIFSSGHETEQLAWAAAAKLIEGGGT